MLEPGKEELGTKSKKEAREDRTISDLASKTISRNSTSDADDPVFFNDCNIVEHASGTNTRLGFWEEGE